MAKRIRGLIKNAGTSGISSYVGAAGGYHQTWDTGRASFRKRMQRLTGINKPAE